MCRTDDSSFDKGEIGECVLKCMSCMVCRFNLVLFVEREGKRRVGEQDRLLKQKLSSIF